MYILNNGPQHVPKSNWRLFVLLCIVALQYTRGSTRGHCACNAFSSNMPYYLQQSEPLLVVKPLHSSPEPADHYVVVMIAWRGGEWRGGDDAEDNADDGQDRTTTWFCLEWSPAVQCLMASHCSQSICLLNELQVESEAECQPCL